MSRMLPFLIFLATLTTTAAEIPISDIRTISARPDYKTFEPVVAAGGDGFLVVWSERYWIYNPAIVMIRAYDADGKPLQPFATVVGGGSFPKAVWTGSEYLVVTGTNFGRFGVSPGPGPVTVTRVRRDGTLVDAPSRSFTPGVRAAGVLSLAWNGSSALAVVEAGGRHLLLLDRDGALISNTVTKADIVAVAAKGREFFLLDRAQGMAVAEGRGRHAVLDSAGTIRILDSTGLELERVVVEGNGVRSIAYDGGAWITAFLDDEGRVCTASFTGAHDVTRSCRDASDAMTPFVAAGTRRTLVSWSRGDREILTDFGAASEHLVKQTKPTAAVDSTGLLVAWQEGVSIRLGGLKNDGTRRTEHVVTEYGFGPRLAANLLVWYGEHVVRAVLLDTTGAPVVPEIELGDGLFPEVATNGNGWVVVFENSGDIHLRYITPGGIVAGVFEVTKEMNNLSRPVIAAMASGYLVAWTDQKQRVFFQKLDGRGLPISGQTVIEDAQRPAVGCNAQTCMILFIRGGVKLVGQLLDGQERAFVSHPSDSCCPSDRMVVVPEADGTFRIHRDPEVDFGGVVMLNGRTRIVYGRDGRIYARDLLTRARGVRR